MPWDDPDLQQYFRNLMDEYRERNGIDAQQELRRGQAELAKGPISGVHLMRVATAYAGKGLYEPSLETIELFRRACAALTTTPTEADLEQLQAQIDRQVEASEPHINREIENLFRRHASMSTSVNVAQQVAGNAIRETRRRLERWKLELRASDDTAATPPPEVPGTVPLPGPIKDAMWFLDRRNWRKHWKAITLATLVLVAVVSAPVWLPSAKDGLSRLTAARDNRVGTIDSLLVLSIIGAHKGGGPLVSKTVVSGEAANRLNARLFQEASDSIKIVTVHGGSWIQDLDVLPSFRDAARRASVQLLVVDPAGPAYDELIASDVRGFEHGTGNKRLSLETLRKNFDTYRRLAQDEAAGGRHLRIRYYSEYPWIRFTIYDNARATFVLVPFLKSGRESQVYYSEDPWVIECLSRIFERFKGSSRSMDSVTEYEGVWGVKDPPPDRVLPQP